MTEASQKAKWTPLPAEAHPRIVFERLQTSTSTATQRIMFQLEFVGFTRLGVNPLKSLKDNIPGYQILREPGGLPSRFGNYD